MAIRLARQCARDIGSGVNSVRPWHFALAWLQIARPELRTALTTGVGRQAESLLGDDIDEYRATLSMAGVDPARAGDLAASYWDATTSAPLDDEAMAHWGVAAQETMHLLDKAMEFERSDHVRLQSATSLLPMLRALAEPRTSTFARLMQLAGTDVETVARRLDGSHRPVAVGTLADRFTVAEMTREEEHLTRYVLHDVEWRTTLNGEVRHGVAFATMAVRGQFCEAVAQWARLAAHPNVLGCVGGRDLDGSILVVTDPWDQTLTERLAADTDHPRPTTAALLKIAQVVAYGLQHVHAAGLAHGAVTADAVVLTGHAWAQLRAPGLDAAIESLLTDRGPSSAADVRDWGTLVRQMVDGRTVPDQLAALLEQTTGREPVPLEHVLDVMTELCGVDGTLGPTSTPTPPSLVAEALTRESLSGSETARTPLLEATGRAASDPYVLMHAARMITDAEAGQELLDDGLTDRRPGPDDQVVRAGLAHFRNHPAAAAELLDPATDADAPMITALRQAIDSAREKVEEYDAGLDAEMIMSAVNADGTLMAGVIWGEDDEGWPLVVLSDLHLPIIRQLPLSVEPPSEGSPFAVSSDGTQLAWCSDESTVAVIDTHRGVVVQTHDVLDLVRHLQFTNDGRLLAVTAGGAVARLGLRPPARPDLQPRPVAVPTRTTPPPDLLRRVRPSPGFPGSH